ncbi:eIF1-like protein [Tilletiaria anomala UBC 951]|uniref:Translation machinery-associated protein 22 n=1 Tax=Tilletiaria anomala (strain ATCC 24038 / CBS 436.72 / UBC 951) TaxID=1037660 RepID=A0A066WMD4_TILAU|nr:eIF1-like protein [Tilletiaria anomala UBC 951]KDN52164.1 eIF1-like protein [Tilletiaria anomala UBC 951]
MSDAQDLDTQGASSSTAQAPVAEQLAPTAPVPLQLVYCQVCTFPPEYCEFGSSVSKCRTWLEKAHPEMYAKVWSDEAITANLANMTAKQADDLEKEAAKKERKAEAKAEKEKAQKSALKIILTRAARTKRKATTSVGGLHHFIPPLPAMKVVSKGLASRLATGASVSKSTSNPNVDEIVIQGDVADEIKAMIVARQKPFNDLPPESAGGPSEKNIIIEEEKSVKKLKGDAPAAGAEAT